MPKVGQNTETFPVQEHLQPGSGPPIKTVQVPAGRHSSA